jgi:neurofibromin 1
MIFQYDYAIPLSLCNVSSASETDNVATALLASFASKGKSLTLLRLLIENEVQQTSKASHHLDKRFTYLFFSFSLSL